MPLVLCTTGLSEEQIARVSKVSKVAPVLRSANMSLGINTLFKVLKSVAPLLADAGFDIEIVEKHHHLNLMHRAELLSHLPMPSMRALQSRILTSMTEAVTGQCVRRMRSE